MRFVKQQKYLKVMLETLFSVTELFLIKKNKKLVLKQTESNVESTSEEDLKTNSVKIRSRREQYLLENTFRPIRDKRGLVRDSFKQILEPYPIRNKTKSNR